MATIDFTHVKSTLNDAVGTITPATQLVIRWRSDAALSKALGWLEPDAHQHPTRPDTRFDMASVSKLFSVTTLMTLVESARCASPSTKRL